MCKHDYTIIEKWLCINTRQAIVMYSTAPEKNVVVWWFYHVFIFASTAYKLYQYSGRATRGLFFTVDLAEHLQIICRFLPCYIKICGENPQRIYTSAPQEHFCCMWMTFVKSYPSPTTVIRCRFYLDL